MVGQSVAKGLNLGAVLTSLVTIPTDTQKVANAFTQLWFNCHQRRLFRFLLLPFLRRYINIVTPKNPRANMAIGK